MGDVDSENQFLSLFGEELYSPSTKEMVPTAGALTGKTVMIYFSAHWCPPCRQFTPKLISLYNHMKNNMDNNHNFELVFCSLDRSEAEYNDYISDFPWKCIPYSSPQELRTSLAMKYKAQGIPHLVVVENDEKDRTLITLDGTTEVQLDPLGDNFPWRPKGFAEIWPGQVLLRTQEKEEAAQLESSSTLDKAYLMLYFSAHWCPPCRQFTPKLCQAYKKLKEERGDEFELIFVSSDRDQDSFNEYYGSMPFGALPFEEREAKNQLSKLFGIKGIPNLLILGPVTEGGGDRPLINDNLRGVIESGDFSEFPFYPKPYADLAVGAEGINDNRSLVVFCENEDDEEQAEIVDMVQKVSEKMKDSGIKFFYATLPGGMVGAVRKVLKIEKKLDSVIMALIDIPDNGGYYLSEETDLTEEKVQQFIENPGERQQMTR